MGRVFFKFISGVTIGENHVIPVYVIKISPKGGRDDVKNKKFSSITRIILFSILFVTTGYVLYQDLFQEEKIIATEVGNTSPDFTLPNLNGKEHTLTDYEGK